MNKEPSNSKKRKQVQQNTIPLPDPIELAKLAAMLRPDSSPKVAMQKAMEFYVEAVLFAEELPDNFDDLLTSYGSGERKDDRRRRESDEAIREDWEKNTLKLEPKEDFDEARTFLEECAKKEGIKAKAWFQSANQVLAKIEAYQDERPKGKASAEYARSGSQLVETFQRKESDGTIFFAIPKWLLKKLVIVQKRLEKQRASARSKKGWETKKAAPSGRR
jgi:hypothetical protein